MYILQNDVNQALLQALQSKGTDFFISVPCKLLGGFIKALKNDNSIQYLPVNHEGKGLGLCMHAYLGDKIPIMVMQISSLVIWDRFREAVNKNH